MVTGFLGIDIAKQSFQCTLLIDQKRYHRTCTNRLDGYSELATWLAKHKFDHLQACMEATGAYWEELALFLYKRGIAVSVVNPARIKHYAQSKLARNKTDKIDGDLIAEFCSIQQPPAWQPLPAPLRQLRDQLRYLEDLQVMRVQEANRLSEGAPIEPVRRSLEEHLAFLDEQVAKIQQEIQELADQQPELRAQQELLVSIPGIGQTTALKLLSENIQSFSDTRSLVAFAGLNPQMRQSGTSLHRKPRLSKIGSRSLRKTLYFPAITAMRYNPVLKAFAERLEARKKPKMVIVGAVMRKLLCLALGVLKSGVPFDPNYVVKQRITLDN